MVIGIAGAVPGLAPRINSRLTSPSSILARRISRRPLQPKAKPIVAARAYNPARVERETAGGSA
jgi:hypothetical protein